MPQMEQTTTRSKDSPSVTPTDIDSSALLAVNSEWALYLGFMGDIPDRLLGGTVIYFPLHGSFSIRLGDGPWLEQKIAVIPPFVRHDMLSGPEQLMVGFMLEPDVFKVEALHLDQARVEALALVVRNVIEHLPSRDETLSTANEQWINSLLGGSLERRSFDPRIEAVVEQIRMRPCDKFSANEFADLSGLSFSRFLHLFKEETKVAFRRYVAWKRARSVLGNLRKGSTLTDIALNAGYPDSTHFSHSIRRAYGLQAKEMFYRCSNVSLYLPRHN